MIVTAILLFVTNYVASKESGKINIRFFLLSLVLAYLINWMFQN
nr:MAG TPA: hypothetical protein [Caudoviricetes sp.]